jgi:hypothetical protein
MTEHASVPGSVPAGAIAGAVGTYAIDVTTYLDVILRARPSSSVPGDTVERILRRVGIDVASGDDERATARRNGLGALMGYGAGALGGVLYATIVRRMPGPTWLRGMVLGTGVMALTDGASVAAGATDARSWGAAGWLADSVPHAIYGLVTAAVYERL